MLGQDERRDLVKDARRLLLFGLVGLIFATPAMLAVIVAVRRLYVRDTLGHKPSPDSNLPG